MEESIVSNSTLPYSWFETRYRAAAERNGIAFFPWAQRPQIILHVNKMFQILISGTRNQLTETQKETIRNVILTEVSNTQKQDKDIVLIHGACTGVDLYADSVAKVASMPAQWNLYGKAAGPIRNSQMLDMKPDILLAFLSETSKGIRTQITILE